jgi:trimeric autotransporter adhesin
VAGTEVKTFSGDGGLAISATLSITTGVTVDVSGNLYIADYNNYRIRMVTKSTGIITTVAGTGISGYSGDGGLATSATLHSASGVTVDASGNLYIADVLNHLIRMVTKSTGIITTVAGSYSGIGDYRGDGGLATSAGLDSPQSVAVDASGNLYIADTHNNRIRMVYKSSGRIATVAGAGLRAYGGDGGLATSATLKEPYGITVDVSGNLYIADTGNNCIRMVSKSSRMITTVAGNGLTGYLGDGGLATSARLNSPQSVAVDASGNLYIADTHNNRIRMVTKSTGIITTVVGTGTYAYSGDGRLAISSTLYLPTDITLDASGNLFVADSFNNRIRMISLTATPSASPSLSSTVSLLPSLKPSLSLSLLNSPSSSSSSASVCISSTSMITTVAGSGPVMGDGGLATSATLSDPNGVTVDASGNLYIADYIKNRIRMVSKSSGIIATVAGTGGIGHGGDGGLATSATLNSPQSVAVDVSGNLYIADYKNNCIRMVTKSTGIISTVAGGDGRPLSPRGITVDVSGNLYFSDGDNIQMVPKSSGRIILVAGDGSDDSDEFFGNGFFGDGGLATSASLDKCNGITLDASGNLYIADTGNHRIRMVSKSSGIITTVAGTGLRAYEGDGEQATSATLNKPQSVAVDTSGNLYIADTGNNCIRMATKSTDIITTVAGTGISGYSGDGGLAISATLHLPTDITLDASGNLFVADSFNNRIRMISLTATPSASPSLSSTVSLLPSHQEVSGIPFGATVGAVIGAIVSITLLILLIVRIRNRPVKPFATYFTLPLSPPSDDSSLDT